MPREIRLDGVEYSECLYLSRPLELEDTNPMLSVSSRGSLATKCPEHNYKSPSSFTVHRTHRLYINPSLASSRSTNLS